MFLISVSLHLQNYGGDPPPEIFGKEETENGSYDPTVWVTNRIEGEIQNTRQSCIIVGPSRQCIHKEF